MYENLSYPPPPQKDWAYFLDFDGTLVDTAPDFVTALQLEAHLSPTRSNGLASMLKAIRNFAAEALQAA